MQLMPKQDMTGSKVFVEVSFAICLRAKQLSQANVYPATLLQLATQAGGYIDTEVLLHWCHTSSANPVREYGGESLERARSP